MMERFRTLTDAFQIGMLDPFGHVHEQSFRPDGFFFRRPHRDAPNRAVKVLWLR